MTIDKLYASAWDNAIMETADYINSTNNSAYSYDDWIVLEPFAIVYNLEFDENGYLVSVPEEV